MISLFSQLASCRRACPPCRLPCSLPFRVGAQVLATQVLGEREARKFTLTQHVELRFLYHHLELLTFIYDKIRQVCAD